MLEGKKILIGITGSIAAYKIILMVRLLSKKNAVVKIVMTPNSKDFVSPLVLSTLSKNNVVIELASENSWANHVALGRWADVFLIAPLTCNTLAKMANGLCDNLLLAVYLSSTCPVVVAPAMDEDMWLHPSTKKNLTTLESYGNKVIKVNNGELGSGLFGEGRMAEPEEIIEFLVANYFRNNLLAGKKVLLTAGPTYEALDPVRFIGNHSSGKMGFSIADAFYEAGAQVKIISGPSNVKATYLGIELIKVQSSDEMYHAVQKHKVDADIVVMSAAVADYKPFEIATEKIKKKDHEWILQLQKTKDILHEIGNGKSPNQFIIGFALETNNELANALMKLKTKNVDAIILNSFNEKNKVFGSEFNQISILQKNGELINFESKLKSEIAKDIVNFVIDEINK